MSRHPHHDLLVKALADTTQPVWGWVPGLDGWYRESIASLLTSPLPAHVYAVGEQPTQPPQEPEPPEPPLFTSELRASLEHDYVSFNLQVLDRYDKDWVMEVAVNGHRGLEAQSDEGLLELVVSKVVPSALMEDLGDSGFKFRHEAAFLEAMSHPRAQAVVKRLLAWPQSVGGTVPEHVHALADAFDANGLPNPYRELVPRPQQGRTARVSRSDNVHALHVTLASNLPAIASGGLRPLLGERSAEIGEPHAGVWLFPAWGAMEGAQWLYERFEDDDQVLALLLVDLDGMDVETDPETGYEVVVRTEIAPARISVLCPDMDDVSRFEEARRSYAWLRAVPRERMRG